MADQPQDQSIFGKTQETPDTEQKPDTANSGTPNSNPDPLAHLLKDIVNESGEQKYKSVQDALYALKHAQEYIPAIKGKASEAEQENEALRNKLQTLEDTVLELTKRREQPNTNGVQLDESAIASLVEQTLTKNQKEALAKQNQAAVVSALNESLGDKAEETFYKKAEEMGMTVEEMNAMAARSPKAALALLGISESGVHRQPVPTPTRGSVNSNNFQQHPITYLGREETRTTIGATSDDVKQAADRAAKMVDELHAKGLDTSFLENPKEYFKIFGK